MLIAVLISVGIGVAFIITADTSELTSQPSDGVYGEPRRREQAAILQFQVAEAFRQAELVQAETLLRRAILLTPDDPIPNYNLACALALQGQTEGALVYLRKSIELGFRDPDHITNDSDLDSLHEAEAWHELVELSKDPKVVKRKLTVTPTMIRNGVAFVGEKNVVWDAGRNVFRVLFHPDDTDPPDLPVIRGDDEVAKLVNAWYDEGTAAGLSSVLYDNHDRDHSNIDLRRFPTLTRIEYCREAARENLDHGLQTQLSFNAITIGNSSTSLTGGPYWRSQPRSAQTNLRDITLQADQYQRNHIYVYPEHKDYDPIGSDNGHGDVYPANTPYVLISQGSSYSDKPFLSALAATTAAFRPETLETLKKNGLICPTLQMIFRRCLADVKSDEDYLSGIAHPPVFDGKRIDALRMVKMAHDILPDNLPPTATVRVFHENEQQQGQDYFDTGPRRVSLFTTPAAIARVCRSIEKTFTITIDAMSSRDIGGQPLTWHWSILQGDPDRIIIEPQNDQESIATLRIDHHPVRPIREGSKMTSSRVDIGVFVSNGTYHSAPAIISFYWPPDEERTYRDDGQIQSVRYSDSANGGPYADPFVITAKDWTDDYSYTDSGELTGWTRTRGDSKQEFTRHGLLVVEEDSAGRPLRARPVTYSRKQRSEQVPLLVATPSGDPVEYTYSSESDHLGEIVNADE